ncbi:MAG TPA: CotH kinase family protein [Solirubrobacterales bacterium]
MPRVRIVAALACLGLLMLVPAAAADEIEWMYDPDAVVEIHLGGISEAELDELEAEPDEYVKSTFKLTVDGQQKGPELTDVGVRLKGGVGSSRPVKTGKSGFKVRFDEFVDDQFYFGIKRLTLNNVIQDPSMVHESLTYGLFHELGLPASRSGYSFVTLNGADYGLFLNLETLDEVSLPQWFATTGHLYEADVAKTDVVPGAPAFEVDEGDDEDIGDLENLIAAVNDPEGDWSDDVSPFADLEQMTAHWAVERYVSHWDGYAGVAGEFRPNNYYLHSDAAGVFQMMPWGTDQTWEFNMGFDEPAGGAMFNLCLMDQSCAAMYLEGLTAVHCAAPGLDLPAQAAQLATTLGPYQAREDEAKREATDEEVAEAVEEFEELAADRPDELEDYLTAEGVLGTGTDPCAVPEPGKPSVPAAPPANPIVDAPPLRFGPSKVQGNRVLTSVEIPAAGTVTQRVTARLDGRRVQVCSDQERRDTAARVRIRCHLSKAAREARADGPLRLRVRVGFAPKAGKARFSVRALTAPKRD